ncbi:hypothetical protein FGE12_01120 [Aggregicoccus sp. 17bor-14]|uniref:hypothetical protein n=1 Tax=Myxococcaceae TaxID=31 RepID=UPI00129CEC86|nr:MULTISPECIES: hypothetical protein [Myxococcaceae]MBF5040974.1 hypothetical protein [Simulacricoccus sp. 17bor-14]MRI86762.1 hypothetical protein [Aggregicoccus sp. 17bor-14]
MATRPTNASTRNAAVSAMLDPALSGARDALQRFLEKALVAQFGAGWQASLERDRAASPVRGASDRWDWGSISYRLGHFRAPQAGAPGGGAVSEPLVALARLAKAYRNLFQHEELSDAQVRHAMEGIALLHEALGSKALAAQARAALEVWDAPARGRAAKAASKRPAAKRPAAKRPAVKARPKAAKKATRR